MRTHSLSKIFLATAALGAVLGDVALANALPIIIPYVAPFMRRIAPSSCENYQPPGGVYANAPIANDWGRQQTSTGNSVYLLCPVPDDNTNPHSTVTSVKVFGYDGQSNGVDHAQVCVSYLNTNGGSCSYYPNYSGFPYTGAPGTGAQYVGNYAMTFTSAGSGEYSGDDSLGVWSSHPADLPYVYVEIGPGDTFHGITVSQ
jgi:hypothetical protein